MTRHSSDAQGASGRARPGPRGGSPPRHGARGGARRGGGRGNARETRQLRARLASEAARIMTEGGIQDFRLAKRKAAELLGVRAGGARNVMPSNLEIEDALRSYQRLFGGRGQEAELLHMRRVALEAMRLLERFGARLVGRVLRGTADATCTVTLHAFSEPPEAVGWLLERELIAYRSAQRRLRYPGDVSRTHPSYLFEIDGRPVEAVVFPFSGRGQPPLSPVDGRPMKRAGPGRVAELIRTHTEETLLPPLDGHELGR